jgi:hypothetical protein
MPRHRLLAVLMPLALALGVHRLSAQAPHVSEIEAKHFFGNSGRFSANILRLGKAAPIRNAVIGDGNLEGPTKSTLFIVRVAGEPGEYLTKVKVKVTVRKRGRFVLNRTYDPGIFNSAGNAYLAILIDDTGCDQLTIEARVTAPTQTAPMTGVIPFECG